MSCVFEREFLNRAWGTKHSGTLLMSNGYIYEYDVSEPNATLEDKLENAQHTGRVSSQRLRKLCEDYKSLDFGPLVLQHTSFDAGNTYINIYNPEKRRISQSGDNTSVHTPEQTHYINMVKHALRFED